MTAGAVDVESCLWPLDRREEADQPVEANPNVLVMSWRFEQAAAGAVPLRRIA